MTVKQNNDHLKAAFFDKAEDMFAIFNKDLNIIDVNKSFLRNFRLDRKQVIGKNLSKISPDVKDKGRYDQYKEVIRTGKPLVLDQVAHHPSMGNICNRIKAFKLENGMGGVLTNITDITQAIDELNTFSYKSSHDMRSPIASVLGLINVAENEANDLDTALHYLHLIREQVERLDNILTNLVGLTRIRQGHKSVYRIDFEQLTGDVLRSLAEVKGYDKVHIKKHIAVKKEFFSDKSMLITLLQNLIDNAIKYRKREAQNPYVGITVTDYKKGVKIIVADNGMGIPDQYQQEVFKMFYRATDRSGGSGLGLYTVRHCVKTLRGQIKLDSKEGEGTTFTVLLPGEIVNE